MSVIYKIVAKDERESLQREVNRLLALGWKLQGGVATDNGESSQSFFRGFIQAMTKASKKKVKQ